MSSFDKRRRVHWLIVAAALLAGAALRHGFIAHAAQINGDSLIYGAIAKNWLQHGVYGYVTAAGVPVPTLIRLPGYPLFLAACFRIFGVDAYTAVLYVQAIFDLLTCLLASVLAGNLFGSNARLPALWLAVLCPFTASYVAAPLTETLTLASTAAAFFALERWNAHGRGFNRWLWSLILALAYNILLRPEQGILAAAIFPAMLWLSLRTQDPASQDQVSRPRRASSREGVINNLVVSPNKLRATFPVLVAALLTLLPLVPWTLRNARTFHVFEPLAPRYATDPGEKVSLGFQRWYRTWAIDFTSTVDVYWNYDGAAIQIADLPNRAFDSKDQYTRTDALLKEYNETSNDTPELESRFAALAAGRIAASPVRYYLALPVARLIDMAFRPRAEMLPVSLEWWKWNEHPAETAFAAAYATLNLAYFVLAGVGIALWHRLRPYHVGWKRSAPIVWAMLASILLRSILLLTLDNAEPRYTLEFFPIFFVLASLVFARSGQSSGSLQPSLHSA